MDSIEVAKLTGFAHSTVRKYGRLLGIKYTGEGRRKNYTWADADIARFTAAIKAADGGRDRRGETQKKLKKNAKNDPNHLPI
jgi:hypothetical protein